MAISKSDLLEKFNELFETYKKSNEEYSEKLYNIVDDNDWAFIIKLVAIIDSTLTKLLLEKSGDDRFTAFFDSISVSRKLDLLYELGLCTIEGRTFIKYLIKLRNKLAHDPNELDFNFNKYIEELDKNQRNELLNSFNLSKENINNKSYRKLVIEATKTAIWIKILPLLLLFDFTRETLKAEKENEEFSAQKSEELLELLMPDIFINKNR